MLKVVKGVKRKRKTKKRQMAQKTVIGPINSQKRQFCRLLEFRIYIFEAMEKSVLGKESPFPLVHKYGHKSIRFLKY